jgi:thiol-disulfide isomerase/thioredoxin
MKGIIKISDMKLSVMFLIFLLTASSLLYAQEMEVVYPKVGDTIQDHTFTDVRNYHKNTLRFSDFRGQWLVIDFWARFCSGCISTFPSMNKLSREFDGRAKIIMTGLYRNDNSKKVSEHRMIHSVYEPKEKTYNLTFTAVFDSLAASKYDIRGVPAVFIVDPNGVIRYKTGPIDSTTLTQIIAGNKPILSRYYCEHEPKTYLNDAYDFKQPLFVQGQNTNGGIDSLFLARSLLAKWTPAMAHSLVYGWQQEQELQGKTAEAIGSTLAELFRIGYQGRQLVYSRSDLKSDSILNSVSQNLVLETKRRNLFPTDFEIKKEDYAYAYSITLPGHLANPENFRRQLLDDLHKYFQLRSTLEKRKVLVYKLVVVDKRKALLLKSKGGNSTWQDWTPQGAGFVINNIPFSRLLKDGVFETALRYKFMYGGRYYIPPIFDETGLNFNIDMKFVGDSNDYNETVAALRRHGVDLVEGEKEMECIVIKDVDD